MTIVRIGGVVTGMLSFGIAAGLVGTWVSPGFFRGVLGRADSLVAPMSEVVYRVFDIIIRFDRERLAIRGLSLIPK